MLIISAGRRSDMSAFLQLVAQKLQDMNAQIFIDLYSDEPITDTEAAAAFASLRAAADAEEAGTERRRGFFRLKRDKYMARRLDVAEPTQRTAFTLLAHRVINCDAYVDDRQVFGVVEETGEVWLDVDTTQVMSLIEAARAGGAITLSSRPVE
ncbi:hypothetical protein ACLB9X_33330 [Streptomyces sp. 5K101]|uniref:hypothetical protein n=1 Tax=Streptomyces sp. 5K101 TaxID=3390037 RepID=UPI003976C7F6